MPNRFTPISSESGLQEALAQINRNFEALDAETYSKTIKKGGGAVAMQSGRLSDGRYGEVFYDAQGVPRILIGQAPTDGRPGFWMTKPGFNVLTEVK